MTTSHFFHSRKGRACALLLCLILVVAFVPVTVSAAEVPDDPGSGPGGDPNPYEPIWYSIDAETPLGLWNNWAGSASSLIGSTYAVLHVDHCIYLKITPATVISTKFIRYSYSYSSTLTYSETYAMTASANNTSFYIDFSQTSTGWYTGDIYLWFYMSSGPQMDAAPLVQFLTVGNVQAYNVGYSDGWDNAIKQQIPYEYGRGYDAGYRKGISEDNTILFDAVSAVVTSVPHAVRTMFDYELFGINFFTLFAVGFFLLFAIKIASIFI